MNITLEQVLESRDKRAALQKQMLAQYGLPLVSLTVVMPGSEKRNATSLYIASEAVKVIERQFTVLTSEKRDLETGYEAIFVVSRDALQLKHITVDIEDTHPLGRLFDIDVIDRDGTPISREQIGQQPRRCLVCGDVSAACVRSRKHSVEDVLQVIKKMVVNYKNNYI
ncbi:MAG: citrate lyase holo-[acyl-carrier protein] synthase [Bacteroidales bacterium]|nr:citrate lyase holo-[acyl-carrier protein] synthase [Bacteroidales bacterium]